ncbi:MAG TPA: ATP-binding cassette domain-containing protein [Candidatus Sulfotelmatobacter sp.]|nr:ATP-binding cassette domain-containing protein [Candidatus Sulfotelmatobacter sp.]
MSARQGDLDGRPTPAAARSEIGAVPGVRVEAHHLYKSFGDHPVLRDLELTVEAGETFVILGPSGSGKSVLLKHIVGLMNPDAGQILLSGEPLRPGEERPQVRLAMVFQSSALFNSLTVAENVGLWLKEHRMASPDEIAETVAEKLALVGLAGTQALMPSELSGGMRKRVAIARALAMSPQLILYDEPTAGLDPVLSEQIGGVIAELKRLRITSLVVTHDLHLAFLIADRMGMIHDGRLIATGPPPAFQASPEPVVQAFIRTQTYVPSPWLGRGAAMARSRDASAPQAVGA